MDQKAGSMIKRIVLFALVCIQVNLYSQDANDFIKLAQAKYKEGKYNEGLELAVKAIQADSLNAKGHYFKGLFELMLSKNELAEADFSKAIELNPNNENYFNDRGVARNRMNFLFYAVEDYSEAIRLNPKSGNAYDNRGTAKMQLNEFESAIPDFNKAIEIDGRKPEYLSKRGQCYQKTGKKSLAYQDFDEAIKIDPINLSAFGYRGDLYFNDKKYDKALFDYNSYLIIKTSSAMLNSKGAALAKLGRLKDAKDAIGKAIELDMSNKKAHSNLALILIDELKFQEAIHECNLVIKMDSTSADFLKLRGRLYNTIGQYEAAGKDFEKLLQLSQHREHILGLIAYTRISTGDYNKTTEILKEILKTNPKSDTAYHALGFVYYELGLFPESIHQYNLSIKINPRFELNYSNRGVSFSEMSLYDKAIHDCDSALYFDPNSFRAYNNRGTVNYHLSKYDSSFKDFNRALKIDPRNIYTHLWRGKTYLKTGKTEKANQDLKKTIQLCDSALQINPRDAYSIYYRGQAYEELGNFKKAFADYTKAHDLRKENFLFNKALRELEEKRRKK